MFMFPLTSVLTNEFLVSRSFAPLCRRLAPSQMRRSGNKNPHTQSLRTKSLGRSAKRHGLETKLSVARPGPAPRRPIFRGRLENSLALVRGQDAQGLAVFRHGASCDGNS